MKSERIDIKEEKLEYPCLMEYKNDNNTDNFIVLFPDDSRGSVVESQNNKRPLGHYSEQWDMTQFKPYTGIIQLSND